MDRTQAAGDRTPRAAALVAELTRVLTEEVAPHLERWELADLGTSETQVQQVFRRLGGALLGGLARGRLAAQTGQRPPCPHCGGPLRLVDGSRPRFLQGLVGDLTVRRPYYHCAACRAGAAPLDVAWGLGSGALTPALARVVCRDGIEGAFGQGTDLVWEHLGARVAEAVARRATEAIGQVAEADQRDRDRWCAPAEQAPTTLPVEWDGVLLHARAAWREVKIVRIAPLGPPLVVDRETGEPHLALGPSGYAAGPEEADARWGRALREARRQGWGRGVRTVVALGAGAEWIWHQARWQPGRPGVEVVEIIDFYHVCAHLATVAAAVFGAGSPRAQDWLGQQRHALRHQGPAPVRRALAKLRPPSASAAEEVRKARGYVRTHAARMRYPAFRARHLPIGPGAIESCAKNLIQQRQTQAGMRWGAPGAQAVASLPSGTASPRRACASSRAAGPPPPPHRRPQGLTSRPPPTWRWSAPPHGLRRPHRRRSRHRPAPSVSRRPAQPGGSTAPRPTVPPAIDVLPR